jgi:hypothetical protein
MYTSIVLVALTGSLVEGESLTVTSPKWLSDYSAAQKRAASARKPLAIFVGEGKEGFRDVSEEGELTEKAVRVLSKGYVCVYVDTATESGKKLAKRLQMDGPGVVLKKSGVTKPVAKRVGEVANKDLEKLLVRYQGPTKPTSSRVIRPAVSTPLQSFGGFRGGAGC